METSFANADRTPAQVLKEEIKAITQSPLIKVLLKSLNGLSAVLDGNRQIITLNDHYLSYLNDIPVDKILGLRMGESLKCIHAGKMKGGCGTSQHCRTCGAALAITSAIAKEKKVEKECALEIDDNGIKKDLYFHVRCEPFLLKENKFYILFLRDETENQQRKMLEKAFFHDFSNLLNNLSTSTYMLSRGIQNNQVIESVCSTTNVLIRELEIQRCFMHNNLDYYRKSFSLLSTENLFSKLEDIFRDRSHKEEISIEYTKVSDLEELESDEILLIRILSNMIINALEASEKGDKIHVSLKKLNNKARFAVQNRAFIPQDIQLRLFQKNFSTKGGSGRGIGTYSMKLFGEQILGGEIGFFSQEDCGTEFYLTLPL